MEVPLPAAGTTAACPEQEVFSYEIDSLEESAMSGFFLTVNMLTDIWFADVGNMDVFPGRVELR